MKNANLNNAKKAKNDEFYTRLYDIENEAKFYKDQFKDKIILLPCDDTELIPLFKGNAYETSSKFWVYFHSNFRTLGLKKLIATNYSLNGKCFKREYSGLIEASDNDKRLSDIDITNFKQTNLKGNGDFRSDEVVELFKEADIIITNPPFSLYRDFINQLITLDKQFLIIGPETAAYNNKIFNLFKDNKIRFGHSKVKEFITIENDIITTKKFGNVCWYTNLKVLKKNEIFETVASYEKNKYLYVKYDNYDAVNIDRLKNIPMDYYGEMGVPFSFLNVYNPKQFEIITSATRFSKGAPYIDNKRMFIRLIIKRRNNEN